MAIESQRSAKGLIDSIKQDNLSAHIEVVDPEKLKQAINVSVYIDTMQNKHRSPLQFAAELGKKSDMSILINKGADIYVENNKGRTAYDYAYKANKSDAVNFLSERGYKNTTTPSSSIKSGALPKSFSFGRS
jgi:ankyrin repeat protein